MSHTSDLKVDASFEEAKIVRLENITPTIRSVELEFDSQTKLKFLPGQWIDFFVPKLKKLTGYSMTCTMDDFKNGKYGKRNVLSLAIKKSDDLISEWIHELDEIIPTKLDKQNKKIPENSENDREIYARVGGDFHLCFDKKEKLFNEKDNKPMHYVLIAGGIGITPLSSIFKDYCQNVSKYIKNEQNNQVNTRMTLLYSAKGGENQSGDEKKDDNKGNNAKGSEFALLDELKDARELCGKYKNLCDIFTFETNGSKKNRIDKNAITKHCFEKENKYQTSFWLCGPNAMIDDIDKILLTQLNVKKNDIHYEKWW